MKYRKAPTLWKLEDLIKTSISNRTQVEVNGRWIPARPLGLDSIVNRFKVAREVFIGKCDAVRWPGGQ